MLFNYFPLKSDDGTMTKKERVKQDFVNCIFSRPISITPFDFSRNCKWLLIRYRIEMEWTHKKFHILPHYYGQMDFKKY